MKTAVSSKPTPAWVTSHKSGELELAAQPTGRSTGWTLSFPGVSTGLNLFQADQLVSASPGSWLVSESSWQLNSGSVPSHPGMVPLGVFVVIVSLNEPSPA